MNPECNPNHRLLTNPNSRPIITRHAMPRPGTLADVLFQFLRDRQWHSVQECYDYVKAHYPGEPVTITPRTFGQRNLNRYIEVCITDDDQVRLGKRHPS